MRGASSRDKKDDIGEEERDFMDEFIEYFSRISRAGMIAQGGGHPDYHLPTDPDSLHQKRSDLQVQPYPTEFEETCLVLLDHIIWVLSKRSSN